MNSILIAILKLFKTPITPQTITAKCDEADKYLAKAHAILDEAKALADAHHINAQNVINGAYTVIAKATADVDAVKANALLIANTQNTIVNLLK